MFAPPIPPINLYTRPRADGKVDIFDFYDDIVNYNLGKMDKGKGHEYWKYVVVTGIDDDGFIPPLITYEPDNRVSISKQGGMSEFFITSDNYSDYVKALNLLGVEDELIQQYANEYARLYGYGGVGAKRAW